MSSRRPTARWRWQAEAAGALNEANRATNASSLIQIAAIRALPCTEGVPLNAPVAGAARSPLRPLPATAPRLPLRDCVPPRTGGADAVEQDGGEVGVAVDV